MTDDIKFQFVSNIDDFNKYLPECNSVTQKYLCFETQKCIFILRAVGGDPKTCVYYEVAGGTQRKHLKTARVENKITTILLSNAQNTVLERMSMDIIWKDVCKKIY